MSPYNIYSKYINYRLTNYKTNVRPPKSGGKQTRTVNKLQLRKLQLSDLATDAIFRRTRYLGE